MCPPIPAVLQPGAETTLSDKADELAKLWDNDAVRIQPDGPAEIGKAVIYANDKRWEASTGGEKTLCYKPEIQDLQITGDWAFEWGYFSYKNSAAGKQVIGQGKMLRVLKRQPDGSWKFARVMGFPEKLVSAAPVSHPANEGEGPVRPFPRHNSVNSGRCQYGDRLS
jgi:ketosteroid isomerase-like protein